MIGLHCGYSEFEIDEISYLFYKDLIAEIAIQLQFESVVHLLSRDYSDEKTMEYVNAQNPFFIQLGKETNENMPKCGKKLTMGALKDAGMFKQK